jgi:hypothetical protein
MDNFPWLPFHPFDYSVLVLQVAAAQRQQVAALHNGTNH